MPTFLLPDRDLINAYIQVGAEQNNQWELPLTLCISYLPPCPCYLETDAEWLNRRHDAPAQRPIHIQDAGVARSMNKPADARFSVKSAANRKSLISWIPTTSRSSSCTDFKHRVPAPY